MKKIEKKNQRIQISFNLTFDPFIHLKFKIYSEWLMINKYKMKNLYE